MNRQSQMLKNKRIVTIVATKQDLVAYEYFAKEYYSDANIDLIEPPYQGKAEDWDEGLV